MAGNLDAFSTGVHVFIFVWAVAAALLVPSAFKALIGAHWMTLLSGSTFFLTIGLGNLGIALGHGSDALFEICDALAALSLLAFLVFLYWDVQAALKNLRLAFRAISAEYGQDSTHIIALITQALRHGR